MMSRQEALFFEICVESLMRIFDYRHWRTIAEAGDTANAAAVFNAQKTGLKSPVFLCAILKEKLLP